MGTEHMGAAIESARQAAGLSQRTLAERADISQPTLSRIISGARTPKMPEIIRIAETTGTTVGHLTGTNATVMIECAARATNGSGMEAMRRQLQHFIELDAFLTDHAIPEPR